MLRAIKKLLGIETDIKGKEIDFDNCWIVDEINDRNKFLALIISIVPEDSIWSIEGLADEEIYHLLSIYPISDDTKVWKGTVWPKQNSFKVKLSKKAKEEILLALPNWNLESNFVHQHIYKDEEFYLTSYDNLDKACTWVSKSLDQGELEKLKELRVIDFYDCSEN
ncbi:hypothetical protein H9Q13_00980 [Pontibacter sp. JH31]|uniref:Uncharacterized protein n=1 Tax=Pontibacter aquaedesilientis TaxID=2766980 RepID=A0ABR7XBN6_9BACT|nr:hypothetical protein [Pontibacter aquaedesilientis]MBD1395725.1 hypothetical protein [Pontibacter aquaedesilientis]